MLDLEENLRILNTLIEKLNSLNETLDISSLKRKLEQLKKQSEQDGFWNDKENSNKVFTEIKKLERKINSFEEIKFNR